MTDDIGSPDATCVIKSRGRAGYGQPYSCMADGMKCRDRLPPQDAPPGLGRLSRGSQAAVTENAGTASARKRCLTPPRCGVSRQEQLDYGSTSCRPSLRSSRAWVAQTAVTRIIGWPGLRARVDLISSLTTAGTVLSCSKSQVSISATDGCPPVANCAHCM